MYDKNGREIDLGVDDAGRKLQVQHDTGERQFVAAFGRKRTQEETDRLEHYRLRREAEIADQEQKWGEPLSANEE